VNRPSRSPTEARFAHPAEAHLAQVLDFYGVTWEYEPHTFELDWDAGGRPTRAFTPDFFLPEHDLYIEITTLRQSLVTKKNAKVRRVQEQYGIRVKMLYRRDYEALMLKFGLTPSSAGT
jgi:16S rRNA U516 pseudouridylate synthase RsuA-like enzyme